MLKITSTKCSEYFSEDNKVLIKERFKSITPRDPRGKEHSFEELRLQDYQLHQTTDCRFGSVRPVFQNDWSHLPLSRKRILSVPKLRISDLNNPPSLHAEERADFTPRKDCLVFSQSLHPSSKNQQICGPEQKMVKVGQSHPEVKDAVTQTETSSFALAIVTTTTTTRLVNAPGSLNAEKPSVPRRRTSHAETESLEILRQRVSQARHSLSLGSCPTPGKKSLKSRSNLENSGIRNLKSPPPDLNTCQRIIFEEDSSGTSASDVSDYHKNILEGLDEPARDR